MGKEKQKLIDLGTSFESLRKEEVGLLKDVPESKVGLLKDVSESKKGVKIYEKNNWDFTYI